MTRNEPDPYAAEIERLLCAAAERCGADERAWAHFLGGLSPRIRRGLIELWEWQAHGGQREPEGDWAVWLLMAGRGFGKTRAGAEWVWARARENRHARIALVGGSREDVARVMVEGQSGLLRVARIGDEPQWRPSLGTFRFGNGAEAFVYSAEAPEGLRGPEHHFAWADELAKWGRPSIYGRPGPGSARAEAAWDNLMMGLRLGDAPRCVVTTTPAVRGAAAAGDRASRDGDDARADGRERAPSAGVRGADARDVLRRGAQPGVIGFFLLHSRNG